MNHKIAGVSFRQKEIQGLGWENFDFSLSNKELTEMYSDRDKIYKFEFPQNLRAVLRPEPENEHDENAIAVDIIHPESGDHVHVGYIKRGSTNRIDVQEVFVAEILGGPFKEVFEDENGRPQIETVFDREITVSIHPANESKTSEPAEKKTDQAQSSVVETAVSAPEKKKSRTTALLLCIFLGFFGAHKFYEGKTGLGFLYLFTAGLFLVGWITDIFKILKYPERF